jgi:hypothetical protein
MVSSGELIILIIIMITGKLILLIIIIMITGERRHCLSQRGLERPPENRPQCNE